MASIYIYTNMRYLHNEVIVHIEPTKSDVDIQYLRCCSIQKSPFKMSAAAKHENQSQVKNGSDELTPFADAEGCSHSMCSNVKWNNRQVCNTQILCPVDLHCAVRFA